LDGSQSAEEKYEQRQTQAKSLLDKFYHWLEKANVPPKTALGKAVQYCTSGINSFAT